MHETSFTKNPCLRRIASRQVGCLTTQQNSHLENQWSVPITGPDYRTSIFITPSLCFCLSTPLASNGVDIYIMLPTSENITDIMKNMYYEVSLLHKCQNWLKCHSEQSEESHSKHK